jgi:Fe-S oxidoreductase
MAGCLACKSCAGQCPVKVNVPEFRSRFLELYHSRYLRPARDYLIASLEYSMPYMARIAPLYNGLMGALGEPTAGAPCGNDRQSLAQSLRLRRHGAPMGRAQCHACRAGRSRR